MKKPKAKGPKGKVSYSRCVILSSEPIKCPLCGVDVKPMVQHKCSKEERDESESSGG
jgi:hypothetical protein